MWYWWGPGHVGVVGAIFGGLLWLLVVVLVVALIVRLVRGPRHRYWMQGPSGWTPGSHPDDHEQVLRTRFARGEIDAEQFQQQLDVLRRTSPPNR